MLARQLATPAQRRALDGTGPRADEPEIARLAEVVVDTGAVDRIERMIDERIDDALSALDTVAVDETARTALVGLADRRHHGGRA